jgi:predicted ATPase
VSVATTVRIDDVEGADLVRLVFLRSGPDVKTEPQRATNVGFGLTYSLPIIVACLAAEPGSLLLIENPEAHLHPRAQAVLGRLLAQTVSNGVQVVVETHSDHVLNAVRLAVKSRDVPNANVLVHFLSRASFDLQPTLSSLAIGDDGMIETWPAGFFDEFDHALDELLG